MFLMGKKGEETSPSGQQAQVFGIIMEMHQETSLNLSCHCHLGQERLRTGAHAQGVEGG